MAKYSAWLAEGVTAIKYLPSSFQINVDPAADRALEICAGALEIVFEIEQRSAQICAAIGHRDRHA
jgi:hypothetical protein